MADIAIGTKLRAVKTGLIATVADVNKKYRTAFVEFNDNTNASYSLSTLKDKRRFVVVTNDDEVESVKKQESEDLEAVNEEHVEEHLISMPGIEKLAELKNEVAEKYESSMIDSTLLSKFTKKEQKIITMIYKGDDKLYHTTVEHAGNKFNFDNKSLLKIGLEIRAIVKGV